VSLVVAPVAQARAAGSFGLSVGSPETVALALGWRPWDRLDFEAGLGGTSGLGDFTTGGVLLSVDALLDVVRIGHASLFLDGGAGVQTTLTADCDDSDGCTSGDATALRGEAGVHLHLGGIELRGSGGVLARWWQAPAAVQNDEPVTQVAPSWRFTLEFPF
jgi:hypothetical protein